MDTAKEVTAQFFALGIPLVTLETPNATETIGYHAVFEPETKTSPERIKPVAVGEYKDGISVKVGLPPHFNPVDVYLGLSLPNSNEIFMVDPSNNFVPLSSGLTPWKSSITSKIDETIFSNIPTGLLPDGEYDIHFMVTPAGDLSKYYHWRSSFDIYPNVNPLVP
jgi:hypothetical protein